MQPLHAEQLPGRIPRRYFLLLHLLLGLLCALLLPFSGGLEEEYGLRLAYWLRGERAAPPGVHYIAIDQASAQILDQPPGREPGRPASIGKLADWDRALFGRLVERLANAGAAVIVFDVNFEQAGSDSDRQFAAAIARAGNVVLLEMPQIQATGLWNLTANGRPAELFAGAAAAVAPMHFIDEDARVLDYGLFVGTGQRQPALPLVALYLLTRQETDDLAARCSASPLGAEFDASARLQGLYQVIQELKDRTASAERPMACDALLHSPIGLALQPDFRERRFLNFYAAQGTFRAASLHQLLDAQGADLAHALTGGVVFVGVADQTLRTDVEDDYDTIFHSGKVAGVELVATAFANLLHDQGLDKISGVPASLLLIGFSLCLGGLTLFAPKRAAIAVVVVFTTLYATTVVYALSHHNLWLPLFFPLTVQAPLAVALGWLVRLLDQEWLSRTLNRFVPDWISQHLWHGESLTTEPRQMCGICMHTDVAGYSTLAERLGSDPLRLKSLEREYWKLLDEQVAREQGIRLEISGDGMTCVWVGESSNDGLAERACRAALGIQRAVAQFNVRHPDTPFSTRIGLHAGPIALGVIGGTSQYTLSVGGDVANTAARLENDINKLLGTRVLVSEAVLDRFDFTLARRVGTFVPRGKSRPVTAYELLDKQQASAIDIDAFHAALAQLESGDLSSAQAGFNALLDQFPQDGPSLFYRRLIADQIANSKTTAPVTAWPIDLNDPGSQA